MRRCRRLKLCQSQVMANLGTALCFFLDAFEKFTLFQGLSWTHRSVEVPRRRLPSPGNWIWNPTRCCPLDRSHMVAFNSQHSMHFDAVEFGNAAAMLANGNQWQSLSSKYIEICFSDFRSFRSWTLNASAPSCRQVRALVLECAWSAVPTDAKSLTEDQWEIPSRARFATRTRFSRPSPLSSRPVTGKRQPHRPHRPYRPYRPYRPHSPLESHWKPSCSCISAEQRSAQFKTGHVQSDTLCALDYDIMTHFECHPARARC